MAATLRMAALLGGLALVAVAVVEAAAVEVDAGYHEFYFPQAFDHFQPLSRARWPHRYLLGNASWDGRGRLANGCRGPILLYAGNEGNIEEFWASNGFMIDELAPKWGALLVFPEQRFYGKSQPFGNASLSSYQLSYLTTSQVLEDYVALLAHLKGSLPDAAACPVIAFGGSYGGTLAALLRASRPAVVDGALAASSELGYYDLKGWASRGVSEFAFEDVVVRDYASAHPACLPAIHAATRAIEASSRAEVAKAFGACSERALGPQKSSLFTYALEGLAQQDYPYQIGNMPANPVKVVCDMLVSSGNSLEVVGKVTGMALGVPAGACLPEQGPGGPGNTPGDGPGPGSWGWQSCTETLHGFSARVLRNYTFNYVASAAECLALYGKEVQPDMAALARRYGGYALADGSAGATRLIWSHGTLDPWHGWFRNVSAPPAGSDVHHILMEGAAHHLDLRGSRPEDPPSVTRARRLEAEIIHGWIVAASAAPAAAPTARAAAAPAALGARALSEPVWL